MPDIPAALLIGLHVYTFSPTGLMLYMIHINLLHSIYLAYTPPNHGNA